MVNAGFVEMIVNTFEREPIVCCCDHDHFKIITENITNDIKYVAYDVPQNLDDDYSEASYYRGFLESVLDECPEIDKFFVLSIYRGNLRALYEVASQNTDINFYVVVHAWMERITEREKIRKNIFHTVRSIRMKKDQINLINSSYQHRNIRFIIYSPYTEKYLGEYLKDVVISKFNFLHQTYGESSRVDKQKHTYCNIGIIGAGMNDISKLIVKNTWKSGNIRYIAVSRNQVLDSEKSVEEEFKKGIGIKTERQEIIRNIAKLDYILIPYAKNEYKVSTSGVLMDAVHMGIPVIMLDSPCLDYYQKRFEIGWEFHSIENLCDFVIRQSEKMIESEEYKKRIKNMQRMVQTMQVERSAQLKMLIQK